MDMRKLAFDVLKGDRRAAARLISLVEDEEPGVNDALNMLYGRRNAHVVGITGSAGVGKSTVLSLLARQFRKKGQSVAIVAVDPTSPLTGGALLGDRIRMGELSSDPDVFIRSLGSRGGTGGISIHTSGTIRVLEAMGSEIILVETVGAGQTQVDILSLADTVVLVTMPGSGDEVQSIKAGLLEIADIYVVNKADLQGAMSAAKDLRNMLELSDLTGWRPPVLLTSALSGSGIDELMKEIERHRSEGSEVERKRRRRMQLKKEIMQLVFSEMERRAGSTLSGRIDTVVESIMNGQTTPYSAAFRIADELAGGTKGRHRKKL